MKRTIKTLQDKIKFIEEHTTLTATDLLNQPSEIFEKIYDHVVNMREAIHRVECDVILYGGKTK